MPSGATPDVDVGLYVYGVVPVGSHGQQGSLRGVDDAAVTFVEHGDLAAAVTEVALDRPPGRSAELRAHGAVVDALAAAGPVVPTQFGAIMADDRHVVDELLAPRHDALVGTLDRLRGTCEMRLRATYVEEQVLTEVVEADPRIAELRRRTAALPEGSVHPERVRLGELVSRAMEDKRAGDSEDVMTVVRPYVLAEAPLPAGGTDHLHTVALLVEDERVADLEQVLEQLAEAVHERIRLALVGPMAPYDFVEEAAWV